MAVEPMLTAASQLIRFYINCLKHRSAKHLQHIFLLFAFNSHAYMRSFLENKTLYSIFGNIILEQLFFVKVVEFEWIYSEKPKELG